MKIAFVVISFSSVLMMSSYGQDSLSHAKFDYTGDEFSPKMNKHVKRFQNTLGGYFGMISVKNEKFTALRVNACEIGIAMIKFKVTEDGLLTELACTRTTPPALAEVFKEIVALSAKYWKAHGDKNLYYIFPIHYNFKFNCKGKQIKVEFMESHYIYDFDDGVTIEDTRVVILNSHKYLSGLNEKDLLPPPKY